MKTEFKNLYAAMKQEVERKKSELIEELKIANEVHQEILDFIQFVKPDLSYIDSISSEPPYVKNGMIQNGVIILHTNLVPDREGYFNRDLSGRITQSIFTYVKDVDRENRKHYCLYEGNLLPKKDFVKLLIKREQHHLINNINSAEP